MHHPANQLAWVILIVLVSILMLFLGFVISTVITSKKLKRIEYEQSKFEAAVGGLTFVQYQEMAARTINKNLNDTDKIQHSLLGMGSEVGELQGIYQKVYQGHELDQNHAMSEVGDLLWFVAEWCTAYEIDMADVARHNYDKLLERFPDGFEEKKSVHRKKGDI